MKNQVKEVEKIVSVLTKDEQQLLKDTINRGFWGDGDQEFLNEDGSYSPYGMYGYCVNDAQKAGHFKGHVVATMFRSIYKKLCPEKGIGRVISHCSDWWENGSGDMLFIRIEYCKAFEEWAKL
jgi:hypothetical protein